MASLFEDASLVMIPSGYKDGKVYSIKPTNGDGDLTFTRSNDTATRVGPDGLIEKVRTNVLLQSNSFDTTWVNTDTTETGGQSGYDGSSDAWLLDISGGTDSQHIGQSISVSGVQTFSFYAKAGSKNWVMCLGIGASIPQVYFDLQNGVVGTESNATGAIVSVGNGWYRCSMSHTETIGSVRIYLATADNDITQSSGNILIQDAQIEAGDIATDYIATTSAAVSVGPVANLPRLDYLDSSCPKLLLEPQRTNLVTYSEQFDNAAWSKDDLTVTANATISPDGYQNADKIVENTTNGIHRIREVGRVSTTGDVFTASCFFKASERSKVLVGITDLTTGEAAATFDLSNGTGVNSSSGSWTNTSFTITNYLNGWYRCAVTGTQGAGGSSRLDIYISNGSTISYAGTAGFGLFMFGAQLEASASYETSYIPTLSAASTRGVDFGSSSDMIGTSYTSSDFSYFIEFNLLQDSGASNSPMLLGGGNFTVGASGQGYLRIGLSGNNSVILFGHGDSQMATVGYAFTKATRYKLLVKRSGTSIKFYVNGAQVGATGTSSLDFTLRSIGWSYAAGSYNTYGNIYQFLAFQTALSDAEAIALTTL